MENFEPYLNELESLLENILNWKKINPEDIKRTHFGAAFVRIEQFNNWNQNQDERQMFVNEIFRILDHTTKLLIEKDYPDYDVRQGLISEISAQIRRLFSNIKPNVPNLTTQAKIVLLEYLGALNPIIASGLQNQQQILLMSLLLERDATNIKKAINSLHSITNKSDVAKNLNSLNSLKEIAILIKSDQLLEKIEADLTKIKKSE